MTVTIHAGHVFGVSGEVTPANLTALMGSATIGGLGRANVGGGFYGVTATSGEPATLMTGELWWDTVNKFHLTKLGALAVGLGLVQTVLLTYYDNNPGAPSHGNLQAGEVVLVNSFSDDGVMVTANAQDLKVAGIALASVASGSMVPIALAGIVNADFSHAPTAGRLVCTSGTRGKVRSFAGNNPPGAISPGVFGIALETKASTGMAKILLNFARG